MNNIWTFPEHQQQARTALELLTKSKSAKHVETAFSTESARLGERSYFLV